MNMIDKLRKAIHDHAPKARIYHGVSQDQNTCGFVVESGRGLKACIGYEAVDKDVEAAAKAFWRMEEIAQGHRDEKGLLTPPRPTAGPWDPGYLMDSMQHGALPAGSEIEITHGCYLKLWEDMKIMRRVQGDLAMSIPCPPAKIELEVPGGRITVEPLPQAHELHSDDCGTKYRGCAPDCPKDQHERRQAAMTPSFQEVYEATKGIPVESHELRGGEAVQVTCSLPRKEPACSCENVSVGHAPGCLCKAWKDAR